MSQIILVVGHRRVGKKSFCRRIEEAVWNGKIEEDVHLTVDMTVQPQAIIIMFSLVDMKSFNQAELWYQRIKDFAVPVVFVGNKYDLESWKISEGNIEKLRSKSDFILYFPTSTKEDILVEQPVNYLLQRVRRMRTFPFD